MIALLPRLRRFTRALTGSVQDADDLAQTTCERALAKISLFEPGTRMDSWLFRIARNLWIDQLRTRGNRGEVISMDNCSEAELASTEAAQESHIDMRKLDAAMAQLPEEQRTLLVLVCVEGYSYKETAMLLQIPLGTVMSRLARARRRLGELLNTDPR